MFAKCQMLNVRWLEPFNRKAAAGGFSIEWNSKQHNADPVHSLFS